MIPTGVEKRLRRSWHHLRRRMGAGAVAPRRLVVEKAPWLNDARSPAILMIDDLTNAWHSHSGGDRWEPGGDWGGGLDAEGSALRFLEERLLCDFPEARVTFFTVAGPTSAYTRHQPFSHAAPMNETAESRRFFARLASDPRFELAYHGYNHGTPGDRSETFLQEFRGYASREAAVAQTNKGLAIFAEASGIVPRGGKYGGWAYAEHADAAIDDCGFLWWCRDWMPRDLTGRVPPEYYEPHFFGRNLVVALPTTLHGQFWDPRQVDLLLERRQIIAVEEHIAPVRPDGRVQTPNIVDDMDELRRLYQYLRRKSVWHATGTEVASYVIARERTLLYDVTRDGFSIQYSGRLQRPLLTLRINTAALGAPARTPIEVVVPDGTRLTGQSRLGHGGEAHLVTVPVVDGRYEVRPRPG